MGFVASLLTSLLGGTISAGLLGLLFKYLIESRLARDLEQHKANLQGQLDKQKATIERLAKRGARADEKLASHVESIHVALRGLVKALEADSSMRGGVFFNGEVLLPAEHAPHLNSPAALSAAKATLEEAAIHLDRKLCSEIEEFLSSTDRALEEPRRLLDDLPLQAGPDEIEAAIEQARRALNDMLDGQVRTTMQSITDQLRLRLEVAQ